MFRVVIWVESFILPISTCSLCKQKSHISKSFHRFSKFLPPHKDAESGHLGGKFQVQRYFPLAMERWKVCKSTTFEILPISTCTLCQQKYYFSKGIQTIFEMFCLSSKISSMDSGVEGFRCAGILLLKCQDENFGRREHLKFCHFHLVHCGSKNPISPKVFKRFSKFFPQLEDVVGGHLGGNIQVRRCFSFAMARRKFCASTTFEILPISTCTLCQQKSYISNGIQPIFEIFASARRCWGWAFGWKVLSAQGFYLCNARWKLCASTTFEILPFSTCTLCQKKSYISKSFQPIFKIFA